MTIFLSLENAVSKSRDVMTVGDINYKDLYFKSKKRIADLEERNQSLQRALVAADRALAKSKVPEVPFTKQVRINLFTFDCTYTA